MKKDLIIDLGMHAGDDTAYYLARGFRVLALEANPFLVGEARHRFRDYLASGDLFIVNAALSEKTGEAPFYLAENAEWSSLDKWRVEKTGEATEITIKTLTLADLVEGFGTPHYIKCDIEGADGALCAQLSGLQTKPRYVSVEGNRPDWLDLIAEAGYTDFQLLNQGWVRRMTPKIAFTVDGQTREWHFDGACSGPFGEDLPGQWADLETVKHLFTCHMTLRAYDHKLTMDNWFDFHARLPA